MTTPSMIRCLAGLCAFVISTAFAAESLYRINSRDVGWDAIDLTITETRREGQISVLQIPNYARLAALEARFAMCAFTDIAIQRGYEAWVVSEASSKNDIVRVGFLKSKDDDAGKLLGKEFIGEGVLKAEVTVININQMCHIQQPTK